MGRAGCVALVTVVLTLVLSGCGGSTGADVSSTGDADDVAEQLAQTAEYHELILLRVSEWDDLVKVANSTGRIALAGVITQLQEVKREVAALEIPDGLQVRRAHGYLVDHMDYTIDAFLLFMGGEPDSTVTAKFKQADAALNNWTRALTTN